MGTTMIVMRILDMLVVGTSAVERVQTMRARISAIQAEGRDPTDAEWEELFAEQEALGARLDAADKRLNG